MGSTCSLRTNQRGGTERQRDATTLSSCNGNATWKLESYCLCVATHPDRFSSSIGKTSRSLLHHLSNGRRYVENGRFETYEGLEI
eukprot:scaffold320_cov335-Pavlova_lutheri.AAC.20